MITTDVLVEVDLDACPFWTCTNLLRWKVGEFQSGFQLQQLWECSNGDLEWRDVEYVYQNTTI